MGPKHTLIVEELVEVVEHKVTSEMDAQLSSRFTVEKVEIVEASAFD